MFFSDTDLYKWLEAACCELMREPDPQLRKQVDDAVDLIGEAQMDDGYIDTFYQVNGIENRRTDLSMHEMYCFGHLIQAAVAHFRATGSESFLTIACRAADHLDSVFGPDSRLGAPGHPEVEMALVELYLLSGITDLYIETGEQILLDTVRNTWDDMTTRKMAITGGVGVRQKSEAFGASYEIPNEATYNETCAQIASFMRCWRMLLLTGEAKYADLMERTFYNGILCGVDLDCKAFFYGNGLFARSGGKRNPWDFNCACCPPNVTRTLSSVHGYFATTSDTGLQIHLYDTCDISADVAGRNVNLHVDTKYPWDGRIRLEVKAASSGTWGLSLRIPEWCSGAGRWSTAWRATTRDR
jgi:hypothetical protein